MIEDYYQILGVSRQADSATIKQAYRRLALQYHPDRHQGSKWHEENFKKITEAYRVLSDEQARAWYDFKLAQQNIQAQVVASHSVKQQAPRRYTPPKPTAAEKKAEKERQKKYAIYTTIAAAVLIVGGITLYFLMAIYSSRYYYQQGDYASAIFHDEHYTEAYIAYAEQLYQARQLEQAIRVVNTGLKKMKPNTPPELQEKLYELQAELYLRLKEYDAAVQSLTTLLHLHPKDETLRYQVAQIHTFWLNNYTIGLAHLDTLLQQNPEHYEAYVGRGYIYYKRHEPQKAIEDLSQAIRLAPERHAAYYYRSYAYLTLSDTLQACQDLKKAHQLGAEHAAIHLLEVCHH